MWTACARARKWNPRIAWKHFEFPMELRNHQKRQNWAFGTCESDSLSEGGFYNLLYLKTRWVEMNPSGRMRSRSLEASDESIQRRWKHFFKGKWSKHWRNFSCIWDKIYQKVTFTCRFKVYIRRITQKSFLCNLLDTYKAINLMQLCQFSCLE